jgi:predicted membrane-bound spermidine synthase
VQRAALVMGAVAALTSLLFPLFRMLPVYIIGTLRLDVSPGVLLVLQAVPIALVVIPPALGFGMAFPLLTELAARRGAGPGAETGRAYLANTAGSIAGSALTGFVLVHTLGSERTLMVGVGIVAVVTVLLYRLGRTVAVGARHDGTTTRVPLLLAAGAVLITLVTPDWSRRLLDRGPAIYGHAIRTADQMDAFLRGMGAEQLRFDEGWNATISVWRNGTYVWLKTNGKADASSLPDMNTQVLLGLLPAMAHPAPARALVIGFGSGTTARTLADVPGIRALDVVEIERAVLRAAPLFREVNGDVLADPRLRIIEDDARSALQLGGPPYDVIVSEPSNPWVAGVAGLFTPEFFTIARARLAEDGVFAQWVQTYRIDMRVVAVVVANLLRVFPHVEVWYANSADLIVLASQRPLAWDRARVARFIEPGTATAAAMRDWALIHQPDDLLGRFIMGARGAAALARDPGLDHDDDRPALEFVAARGLIGASVATGIFDSLFDVRDQAGDTLPTLRNWPLERGDWEWSYARALPSAARAARPMADRALAARPDDPARRGEIGRIEHEAGRDSVARPLLFEAAERLPADARFSILAGSAAWLMRDTAQALALMERARTADGDTVLATSILAEWAVLRGDYVRGAAEATRAIEALRPTLAAPFPGALQSAVQRLALHAPPPLAAPVLDLAAQRRPGWELAWWGGALVHARWGGRQCRRAAELGSELERFGWTVPEIAELLARCGSR